VTYEIQIFVTEPSATCYPGADLSSSVLSSLFQILLSNIPISVKFYKCSFIIVLHSSVRILHHFILFY